MSGENASLHQFPYAPGFAYDDEVRDPAVEVVFPVDASPLSGIFQGGNRSSTPERHAGTPPKGI